MKIFAAFATMLCLTLLPIQASSAKEKHYQPLPPAILAAKTILIDNQSGDREVGDKAYQALKEWGRFRLVEDREQADLVFVLTVGEEAGGLVTTGGEQTSTAKVEYPGNVDEKVVVKTQTSPTHTKAVVYSFTRLVITDSKGDKLYSDVGSTKGMLKDLRKRVEAQVKAAGGEAKKP